MMCGVQLTVLPPVEELQTDPQTRSKWIDYSAYDAKATWQLAQALKKQLMVRIAIFYPHSSTWLYVLLMKCRAVVVQTMQQNSFDRHPFLCWASCMELSLALQWPKPFHSD